MAPKQKQPVDMSSLLSSSQGTLAQIAKKTNYLKSVSSIVASLCPDIPLDAWRIGNFHDKTLIIEVKSAVWSQRFQFEKNNIKHALTEKTAGTFTNIDIKVAPNFNHSPASSVAQTAEKTQFISKEAGEQIREVAKSAPPSLQQKLEKLAALANKKQGK
ncbi:DUF721 domain-containing protein [Thalassotalea agarivorans]|uniref:DUF721 domain-containing protein n=1 Tax=Thalassotalea agarivorans TaxID=349064 RepID=A0A1I0AYI4_THASX|nr:DciA family protein [Thalassotalea agarivorans]SES99597.1 hypothetical protein SAMN05660429_00867 [Thalassotalea agarivorans]